jgi:2-C-methyl-D-erythritol 4-phosphate cytidylyltransferase
LSADPAIWAIVPAAGTGSRMQAAVPKQYLPLLGRPVIQHTLERLCAHARIRGVLVGVSAEDRHWKDLELELRLPKLLGTFPGGATRAHTVLNGLQALADRAQPDDWAMVHDAARPCLRTQDVDRLIDAVQAHADGGLLALPVSDTVKRTDAGRRVVQTVPRANLWRALTPRVSR